MKIMPVLSQNDENKSFIAQLVLEIDDEYSQTVILESTGRTAALAQGHLAVDVRGLIEAFYDLPETRETMIAVIKQRKAAMIKEKETAA